MKRIILLLSIILILMTSCATTSTGMSYDEALTLGRVFKVTAGANPENEFETKFAEYASNGNLSIQYDDLEKMYTIKPAMDSSTLNVGTTVYPYFKITTSGKVTPYVFVQYFGNDWLFFDEIRVYNNNGGYYYLTDFYFEKTDDVLGSGYVREVLDTQTDETFMEYMRNRNGIRLIGDNTETIKFSKSELENIETVLDLYYRLIND